MNLIKNTFYYILIGVSASSYVSAADYIAVGGGLGYQHDAGNSGAYPDMMRSTRKNLLVSGYVKADLWPMLFIRTGYIRSIGLTEGRVLNSSHGSLRSWELSYHALPGHLAFSFPVTDEGSLYMGAGITYFFGSGRAEAGNRESISENLFGYGLIAGLQSRVFGPVSLFAEWDYVTAKSGPVIDTGSPPDGIKDFAADFSGSRIHIGLLYYMVRDER